MAFIPLDPFASTSGNPGIDFPNLRLDSLPIPTEESTKLIIDQPRPGEFRREVVTWRTPHLGFVKMYINPQEMVIEDRKDIKPKRTKGGFVIQYAGEGLTKIRLTGTTGSSGIEGINVLRSIYRAEQQAFEGISVALDEQLAAVQVDSLINSENPFRRVNLFQMANDTLRSIGRPQPTLASLATQIEMFFQGVLYRGYFTSFSVTEKAVNMGLFDYTLTFEAYARQGTRRNFMPWHRQPNNPANADANPFSFTRTIDPVTVKNSTQNLITPESIIGAITDNPVQIFKIGRRSTSTGTSSRGQNESRTSL